MRYLHQLLVCQACEQGLKIGSWPENAATPIGHILRTDCGSKQQGWGGQSLLCSETSLELQDGQSRFEAYKESVLMAQGVFAALSGQPAEAEFPKI